MSNDINRQQQEPPRAVLKHILRFDADPAEDIIAKAIADSGDISIALDGMIDEIVDLLDTLEPVDYCYSRCLLEDVLGAARRIAKRIG